jgi:hypothetical protein
MRLNSPRALQQLHKTQHTNLARAIETHNTVDYEGAPPRELAELSTDKIRV